MHSTSTLIQLPPDLLAAMPAEPARCTGTPAGLPLERHWATALALVSMCAAIAFALPV